MGDYKIVIEAVGGHGCDRTAKQGELLTVKLDPAHLVSCPDCQAHELVQSLKRNQSIKTATLTHWPGQPTEVVDDLRMGVRAKGQF